MKNTTTCPHCQREHEMFWLVRKEGKRDLVFRCDRVPVNKLVGHVLPADGSEPLEMREMRSTNTTQPVLNPESIPEEVLKSLREEYTRGYRNKQQGQSQLQLILMKK